MSQQVATTPARPGTAVATAQKFENVEQLINSPLFLDRMRKALPATMKPERMVQLALMLAKSNEAFKQVPMMELAGAMLSLAALGLEFNSPLQHSWLVPIPKRKKVGAKWETVGHTLQIFIGYQGYIELWHRSGKVANIHAGAVYPGDEFSYEFGSNQHLRHKPMGLEKAGDEPTHFYAHAKLTNGGEIFGVWPQGKMLRFRSTLASFQQIADKANSTDAYEKRKYAQAPWVAYYEGMGCKTMLRQIHKYLPKSPDIVIADAIEDGSSDMTIDLRPVAEDPGLLGAAVAGQLQPGTGGDDDGGDDNGGSPPPPPPPPSQPEKPTPQSAPAGAGPKASASKSDAEQPPQQNWLHYDEYGERVGEYPTADAAAQAALDGLSAVGDLEAYSEHNANAIEGAAQKIRDAYWSEVKAIQADRAKQDAAAPQADAPEAAAAKADAPFPGDLKTIKVVATEKNADGAIEWGAYYHAVLAEAKQLHPTQIDAFVEANRANLDAMSKGARTWAKDLRGQLDGLKKGAA